jgi:hypothetical protein
MYQIHFREPTGASSIYNIVIHGTSVSVYEASILIGNSVVATY